LTPEGKVELNAGAEIAGNDPATRANGEVFVKGEEGGN